MVGAFDKLKVKGSQLIDLIKKYPWRTTLLILVVCLSFGLKMAELKTGAQHEYPGSDPYASIQNAHDFLYEGKDINFYLNPMATLYLIFVYAIFGEHLWLAKFIQILASFLVPFFLYYVAKRYFGEVAGFIAAILALIHPSIVFFSAHSWGDFWAIFLISALLYMFVKGLENKEKIGRRAGIMGVLTGFACLSKIWIGAIGAILILFLMFSYFDKKKFSVFFTKSLKIGLFAFFGVAIILGAWIIYASATAGFFVLVNLNSPVVLYIGNNPEGEIAYTSRPYTYEYTYSLEIKHGNCGDILKNTSGTVTSTVFEESVRKCAGKYAKNYILDNPGKFITKMTKFTFNYWLFPNLEFYQRYIKTPKLLKFVLWSFWILGVIGLLVSFSKFREFIPFYIILLVVWFFSGMAFYLARYKAGMAPLAIFFAAGGLYTVGYLLFDKKAKK